MPLEDDIGVSGKRQRGGGAETGTMKKRENRGFEMSKTKTD